MTRSGCFSHLLITSYEFRLSLSSTPPTLVRFFVLPPKKANMGIANFPFPSFTLALSSERVVIPGPSYVIRIAPLVIASPVIKNDLACLFAG